MIPMESRYYHEDIENILEDQTIPWEKLNNKSVLVTGATGLIGTLLVRTLTEAERKGIRVHVIAAVRNKEKAKEKLPVEKLTLIEKDIRELNRIEPPVDYIIHAAGETASKAFVEKPVEVFRTIVDGTENVLSIAKEKNVKGLVFLSTMEVYGTPQTDEKIPEDRDLVTDSGNVRNSYPIAKIAAENLCHSYAKEYGLPVCILRLTQTFGPGVETDDHRVFAEMMKCAVHGEDIILKTRGETRRSYVYTADAARAILLGLLTEEMCRGEAYNVANEGNYSSIAEMADVVIRSIGSGESRLRLPAVENIEGEGYAPTLHMNLDTQKLRNCGWKPWYDLEEMFRRMAG